MLSLSRKVGEQINISFPAGSARAICIQVQNLTNHRVVLAIDADREVLNSRPDCTNKDPRRRTA